MSKSRVAFDFSQEVLRFVKEQGLALPDVEDWVFRSVKVSHPDGNRRFRDWLFRIKGKQVLSMVPYTLLDTVFTERTRDLPAEAQPKPEPAPETPTPAPRRELKANEFQATEPCPVCDLVGEVNGKKCLKCDGTGTITVIRKQSERKPYVGAMR